MKNLQLIKSERFGDIQADIYSNGDDMFMTTNQLCACLEESRNTFDSRLSRNSYLKNQEFSVSCKLQGTDGKLYSTRVFNEDGIYEITMLSESEKAKEFRAWIRGILKALRRGKVKLMPMSDYQREQIERQRERNQVMARNSANTSAKIIDKVLTEAGVSPKYKVVALQAVYEGVGIHLPVEGVEVPTRHYDATAIAKMLNIYSTTGNPHAHAVSAMIEIVGVGEGESIRVPCINAKNGHADTTLQYSEAVIERLKGWLEAHGYPQKITKADGSKRYTVIYQNGEAA